MLIKLLRLKNRYYTLFFVALYIAPVHAAVDISGFATAGFIAGDTENSFLSGPDVITESAQFGADNILGLQVNADVNSKVSVTGQFVAKAVEDSYDIYARWAYISYEISQQLTMRMGRMNFPGALYNDVQEVGFSYPWVRNPIEAYTLLPITSHSGADLFYHFNALNADWVLQSSVGSFPPFDAIGATLEIDLAYGVSLVGFTDYGKLNFSLINTENMNIRHSIGSGGINLNMDVAFATAGVELEFENILIISEVIKKAVKNNPSTGIYSQSDMLAYYLTLAYRMGDFLPHFTYSGTQSDHRPTFIPAGAALPGSPPQGVPAQYWVAPADMMSPSNAELFLQKSYVAGLRYDFNSQTAFKIDFQRMIMDEGSWGVFYTDPGDEVDLISVAVDVVF